jgi:TRAP-type mannitol/chloroaromatic compound transport system substrate-binding protein
MKKITSRSVLTATGIIMLLAMVFMPAMVGAKELHWKMSTTWTPSLAHIETDIHFVKLVNENLKGQLKIKFFEGGSLVPPFEIFDAVRTGTLDAAGDWPNYWAGKNTVFDLLGSYPNGMTPMDYITWIYQGGGFDIYQMAYGKFGMVYLPYGMQPMESGIRGNKPIKKLSDYAGMKIRLSGRTQGQILKKIGGTQVMMAGGEVYQALEKGVIDAGEFATPKVDWGMGFQEVTKYWATPGWHQPACLLGLMINKKSWDKMSPGLQNMIKLMAQANMIWSYTHNDYGCIEGTANFLKAGIKITRLSDADLNKIADMANELTLASAKENKDFAKAAYSMFKFMKDMEQWRAIQSPYAYGRNPKLPDLAKLKEYAK